MGGKGGSKTVIEAPKPVNVEESMRDYLNAITDPKLVGKQLSAEKEFGPQFDLVSLARTQTMLEGIKDPKESQAYLSATARKIALQAKKKSLEDGAASLTQEQINAQIDAMLGTPPKQKIKQGRRGTNTNPEYTKWLKRKKVLEESYSGVNSASMAEVNGEIAENDAIIEQISNSPAQKGILEMAEEAAIRTQELQTELDRMKREGDLDQLKEFGPDLVNALRDADPTSAALAEASAELAGIAQQRAIDGVPQSEERIAMGEIAQQGRDRIAQLEELEEAARSPEENAELQNLKDLRDRQAGMFEQAQARADDPESIRERAAMGMLGDAATFDALRAGQSPAQFEEFQNLQQLGDMGMLSAEAAQFRAMNPGLTEGRSELGQLADVAQAQALDPTSNIERAQLGDMAEESRNFASQLMQEAQNPALPNEERQRLIAMSQQQEQRANDIYARAGDVSAEQQGLRDSATAMRARGDDMFATAGDVSADQQALLDSATGMRARADQMFDTAGDVSPEQQGLRDRAQELANRSDEMFAQSGRVTPEQEELRRQSQELFSQADQLMATAGDVTPEQQQLRNQASSMQQRAQGLFAQAEAAPSEQKQQLQAAAMDMMQRGQGLFQQAATPSSARQAAGQLTQLSAQQARQLSADAMGPLSAQRRRMAEQAARQAGLRTGRIGDQGQLAAELLNREESRAALRAEARQAQDLAFRQASGFATDIETDAERLRQQALGFETGGFDRARGVEGDIDAQRLALIQEGRLAEANALQGSIGIEGQIADQRIAQQGQALDARRLGLSAGTTLEGQIADQEIARQGAANELGLATAEEARGIEGMISDQELARTGQALDAAQLGMQEGRGMTSQISDQEIARTGRALEASQLGMQEGRAMEGQISDQELERLAEGRATAGQGFDMGRAVQSDLDDLSETRFSQALDAQGDARTATTDLIGIDKTFRDEAADRQQAQLDADEAFREEARLERLAADAQQKGLLDEAEALRNEAATRRSEALQIQEGIASFDAGLRDEARADLEDQTQMTAGIMGTELTLEEMANQDAAGLRDEISAAEQTAFAREGQLAQIDESLRSGAIAEADALGTSAFNQSRAIAAPTTEYLLGTSGAAGQGQAAVSQAPGISQAFPEMFNPEPGIDLANVHTSNMLNRNIAQANVNASDRASKRGMIGDIFGMFG
jgi:hypothetical protein